jgi:hypothetical protein
MAGELDLPQEREHLSAPEIVDYCVFPSRRSVALEKFFDGLRAVHVGSIRAGPDNASAPSIFGPLSSFSNDSIEDRQPLTAWLPSNDGEVEAIVAELKEAQWRDLRLLELHVISCPTLTVNMRWGWNKTTKSVRFSMPLSAKTMVGEMPNLFCNALQRGKWMPEKGSEKGSETNGQSEVVSLF